MIPKEGQTWLTSSEVEAILKKTGFTCCHISAVGWPGCWDLCVLKLKRNLAHRGRKLDFVAVAENVITNYDGTRMLDYTMFGVSTTPADQPREHTNEDRT